MSDEAPVGPAIDMQEILKRIPHRYPFLLIDRAEDYRPHKSIVGIKCVTMNEPFFQGHFPNNPVMPGVLIVEALGQTGAVLMSKSLGLGVSDIEGKTILFISVDNCRFRAPVRPGAVLRMNVEVTKYRSELFKFHGKAFVDGKIAAECDFAAMLVIAPHMSDIHPTALVAEGAEIAEGAAVGPYCIIGPKVKLHAGVRLLSHVAIDGVTEIGADTVVHAFASLGGPPQHTAYKGEETQLIVGARNVIREHVTMHTGTMLDHGVTRVGSDSLFMTASHVAHDCVVGDHVIFANNATLGGHVKVGDYVFLGGLSAVHQHTRIGRYAFTGGGAVITKDVIPYGSVWGNHAHLEGLNLVGLKRRGFSREAINDLRACYRLLFAEEGTFQERLEDVADTYASSSEVREIVEFIRADANRPLCMPSP